MKAETYGSPFPGLTEKEFPGKLIALEGTDGVGRSTQAQLVKRWLESSGLAVFDTGFTRSVLAGQHIQEAKQGHTMGRETQCLFYATDFADRIENQVIPALRAGFVVLTDRYIYSLMARSAVRGLDREWLKRLYGFALKPEAIFYLKPTLEALVPRVLASGGFDYWESGMDIFHERTMFEAFVKYQSLLLAEYDRLSAEYNGTVIDATCSVSEVFGELKRGIAPVVADMVPGSVDIARLVDQAPMMTGPRDYEDNEAPVGAEKTSMLDALKAFLSEFMEK